jgi:RimJ/RimL family protein N-acetyltransferase
MNDNNISMSLTFRRATVADCALIRHLASQIWEPTYGHILSGDQLDYMFEMMYSEEHIRKQMEEKGHVYFIVSAEGEPCGYISIERDNEISDLKYIFQKIYCLPALQGKGIGQFMVEQGVEWIKSIHVGAPKITIELYVNRRNRATGFYEHLGFKKTGVRDYPIGNNYFMNDYIMQMDVNAVSPTLP